MNKAFDWNNTEEELERWIEKRDFDGDEKVDFHEFLKFSTLLLQQDKTKREETVSESTADESSKPPDGGWGWIVVFVCFMCNFIVGEFQFLQGSLLLHRSVKYRTRAIITRGLYFFLPKFSLRFIFESGLYCREVSIFWYECRARC